MKYWIGIDPGSNGAICILYEDSTIEFVDFKKDKLIGYIDKLHKLFTSNEHQNIMIGLEKVSAMPGQGVVSMFSFGQRLGELEGMLQTLKVGYSFLRPQEWQKLCQIPKKSGKKGIYEEMIKTYPQAELKGSRGGIMDGRCDSLGIAHSIRIKFS